MLTFKEYYDKCRKIYSIKNIDIDIFDVVGLHIFNPSQNNDNYINIPPNYLELIDDISSKVSNKIDNKLDVTENKFHTALNNFHDIKTLNTLGNYFAREMEKKVYKSFSIVEHLHIYRSIHTEAEKESSWLWHIDNSVNEQLKIMVYLTDVDGKSGPFTSLIKNKLPLKFRSSKVSPDNLGTPKFKNSRIPDNLIRMFKDNEYEQVNVKGKKGTYILFDQNIVHKASTPKKDKYRDVLIFNFRPFHKDVDDKMKFVKSFDYNGDVKTYSTEIK